MTYIRRKSFDGLLEELRNEYDAVCRNRDYYQQRVKEWSKDEEITKEKQRADYYITNSLCVLSDKEMQSKKAFIDKHYASCQNGGRYQYELIGTGIGTAITIRCPICGEEENITDYNCW